MYKKYLLKCSIYNNWLEEYEESEFYFDTKEELIDFVKNGTAAISPEYILIECAFEINKINIEL